MPAEITLRPSARVVLLDADDRLLMLKLHDPSVTRGPNPITADFWLLVGGGVEPGETYEEAARREVFEETGIRDVSIGPCVWTHEKLIAGPDDDLWLVTAQFFVGRVAASSPVDFSGHEQLEASAIVGYHWFTRDEILAREPHETFLPPGLGRLLGDLLHAPEADPISLTDKTQLPDPLGTTPPP
ncbi:MAG: mutator MutT protein [Actinomycetia bacterium]|nr:mutator MutT protein [Actinomycetes bacterium]